jgi:hypothetical protein
MIKFKEFLKELVVAIIVGLVVCAGVWYGVASSPLYGWL